MSKIIKKVWFTSFSGNIGIVVVDTKLSGRKAYIGIVSGFREAVDAQSIADTGCPVSKESLTDILDALNKKEK